MKNLKLLLCSLFIFPLLCSTSQANNSVLNHGFQGEGDEGKSKKKYVYYGLGLGVAVCAGVTAGYYYANQDSTIQKLNNTIQNLQSQLDNDPNTDFNNRIQALTNENNRLTVLKSNIQVEKNRLNNRLTVLKSNIQVEKNRLNHRIQSLTDERDKLTIRLRQALNNNTSSNQFQLIDDQTINDSSEHGKLYDFLYQLPCYNIGNDARVKELLVQFRYGEFRHSQVNDIIRSLSHLQVFLLTRELYFSGFFERKPSYITHFFRTMNLNKVGRNKNNIINNIGNRVLDNGLSKQSVFHCTKGYDVLVRIVHHGIIPSLGERSDSSKRPGAFFALGKPASGYGDFCIELKYDVLFISLPQTQVVDDGGIWGSSFCTIPISEQTVKCFYIINDYSNNAGKLKEVLKKSNLNIPVETKDDYDDIEVQNVDSYIVPRYIDTSGVSQVSKLDGGTLVEDTLWRTWSYNIDYINDISNDVRE